MSLLAKLFQNWRQSDRPWRDKCHRLPPEPLKASKPFDPNARPPVPLDTITAEVLHRWRARRRDTPDLTWSRFVAELQRQDRDLGQTIAALEHELKELAKTPRFTP